jgi:hypothetical protein
MRPEENAVLDSLRRAQQILEMHGDALTAVTPSTRTQLADAITQLEELSVAQDTGARGSRGETCVRCVSHSVAPTWRSSRWSRR